VLACFFDIRVIVHLKFVPKGTTVSQTFYVVVLKRLIDAVRHSKEICGEITQ
jgi:hypothetical protein